MLKILLLVQGDFSKPSFEQITNRHHPGTFAVPLIGIGGLALTVPALPPASVVDGSKRGILSCFFYLPRD